MRLIVAVQEANESEPRVKLFGNHTAPPKKEKDVTSSTPNKCREGETCRLKMRLQRAELMPLFYFNGNSFR